MAGGQVERELKLEAGVGFAVPDLNGVVPGVVAEALPEARLQATYIDTPDLRLLRHGVTLRHRHDRAGTAGAESEWTLKLPQAGDGRLVVRRELTWPGAWGPVPAEADGLVRALRRSTALGPVARLVTQRRRTALAGPYGQKLAEIDDDVVSVMDGRKLAARFREVEVELTPAAPEGLLDAVLGALTAAGAVVSDGRSKVVRALGPRASEPPDVVRPALDRDATVGQVVGAAIAEGFIRLTEHDLGVRLDEDPEDVHQARVATRRLRSDLRTFRDLLDPDWVISVRAELGWVAAALGEVRDADVLTERLRAHEALLDTVDARAAGALLGRLSAQRAQARRGLLDVLASTRYVRLLDELAMAAKTPPLLGAHRPTPSLLPASPPPVSSEVAVPVVAVVTVAAGIAPTPAPAGVTLSIVAASEAAISEAAASEAAAEPVAGAAASSPGGLALGAGDNGAVAYRAAHGTAGNGTAGNGTAGNGNGAGGAGSIAGPSGGDHLAGPGTVPGLGDSEAVSPTLLGADGAPLPTGVTPGAEVALPAASAPKPDPNRAPPRARRVLPRLVRKPWRHVAEAVADLGAHPRDEALHEVRIRAKRLRYASEALVVVAGRPAQDLARAAAGLQGVLGDFNDAVVAEQWLRHAAAGPSDEALVAGQLVAVERQVQAQCRVEWSAAWDALNKKRLRTWFA